MVIGGLSKHLTCEYCKSPWFKKETEVVLSDEKATAEVRERTIYICTVCGQKQIKKEEEGNA